MSVLKRRVGFLILVVFFTIFGAGRSHFWREVIIDESGWVYYVDAYSVQRLNTNTVECTVKAVLKGHDVVDRWTLDAQRMVLVRESQGVPEHILPNSIASHFLVYFRKAGDLALAFTPELGTGVR